MTGKGAGIYTAFISDIHLGCRRIVTGDILQRLAATFPNTAETGELDIIFIAGDLFDRLLTVPDTDMYAITLWVKSLLTICKDWNIMLRVLEGTPSHDFKQSAIFDQVNAVANLGVDCRHVSHLEVEHMDTLGVDILYIPDEHRADPADTWTDVEALLLQRGVEQVDYCIMHGMFLHQLPKHVHIPHHDADNYLKITRRYIAIGHNHTRTKLDRIIAQGSFDRLNFGDEEEKGHVRIRSLAPDSTVGDTVTFIPNTEATLFTSLDLIGQTEEYVVRHMNRLFTSPLGSHFRIIIERLSPHMATVNTIKQTRPEFHWVIKIENSVGDKVSKLVDIDSRFKPVEITRDTIVDIVMARLVDTDTNTTLATEILQSVK